MWVKRTDVPGARYDFIKNVDPQELVAELIARWVAQAKLDVDPSLVTLRLVKCGAGKPTAKQEAKAKALDDPSLSLAEAKVTGTAWMLAFVAGTDIERHSTRVDSPGARMMRTRWHPLTDVLAAFRLADCALLKESSKHKDVFFLGPRGSGPRAFFLDADRAVTLQVLRWLKTARSKWRGVMNENDDTAVSMTITGTPKVRSVLGEPATSAHLTNSEFTDRQDAVAEQSTACTDS